MSRQPYRLTARDVADALWLASRQASAESQPDPSEGRSDRPPAGAPSDPGGGTPSEPTSDGATRAGERWEGESTGPDVFWLGPDGGDLGPGGESAGGAVAVSAVPAVPALTGEREIGRALRPFNRRQPSKTEFELDEETTADRAAEDGLWLPVLIPAGERGRTITLVIDDSASMLVWRRTVAAFTTLLQRQGAFRNVLTYLVDTDETEPTRLVLRGGGRPGDRAGGGALLAPASLAQPGRIVVVLTDGVGQAWRSGAMGRLLADWGGKLPLAVVQLLPRRTWHRTGVQPVRARLRATAAALPNRLLDCDVPATEAALAPDMDAGSGGVPVPVLALDADSLGWWARLVTGAETRWSDGEVIFAAARRDALAADSEPADEDAEPAAGRTPLERVLRFRSAATPTAFKLATYLAAAPLSLSAMQLVQSAMLPRSRPYHLSEVLVSGLIRRAGKAAAPQAQAEPTFEFDDGVREELLAAGLRTDTARVLRIIGEQLGHRVEAFRNLAGALTAPDRAPDPPVTPESAPFVRLQRSALRALSGPYLRRAKRLTQALDRLPANATASPSPTSSQSAPKDIDMSEAPELTGRNRTPAQYLMPDTDHSVAGGRGQGSEQRRPGDPPLVWGGVPPRNPGFTGRERLLDDLHERLQRGMTAVLPEALHGMGGVGKSQIAVEYVYRHTADYDLIWWIPAEHSSQIASALVELAQQMGLQVTDEAVVGVPAVREALRVGRPFRNWLLVFDNAETPETVRPYFPTDGPGHILVTSRNPQWANLARPLEVDVFQREESKELLRRRGPELSDHEADQLAAALGDLPLAIEQAAAWRAETGMPAGEYLRLFEEKAADLLGAVETSDYQLPVAAAWNVSLDRLRQGHPAALQLLQVCSFFAPEPISRNLVSGIRDVPVPPELLAAMRDPIRLSRAIREINRYALARIDHRTNTIQIHRLVQAVLIGQMTPAQRQEMRHAAHALLAGGDPNDPDTSAQWPRYRQLLPHVQLSRAIECEDPWVRNLVINTIQFLYQWGDHQTYRELAQETVDTWRDRFGADDPQLLTASQWLGRSMRLLGHHSPARELNAQTLGQMRETLGEEHEETVSMMSSVAADLRYQGDFAAARDLNARAAEIAERLFGEDEPLTLVARHNLGVSLRLLGDSQTALELDEETQRHQVQVLGEQSRITLNTLNGLGLDELECGHYLAARRRQESTTQRCRHVLGNNHPLTILTIQTLGLARRRAGDHMGAYEVSDEALGRFRARYGKDDPQAVSAAANLAVDLRQTGNLPGSRNLGARTLERYAATLGPGHLHTLTAAVNHAVTLRLLGERVAARELNERTLRLLRESVGADHPMSLTCATNLANDLAGLDESPAACDLNAETLEGLRRRSGDFHPSTLACGSNLALDLLALGRTEEAEALRAQTLERFGRVLGEEHPATVAAAAGVRADCDNNPLPL